MIVPIDCIVDPGDFPETGGKTVPAGLVGTVTEWTEENGSRIYVFTRKPSGAVPMVVAEDAKIGLDGRTMLSIVVAGEMVLYGVTVEPGLFTGARAGLYWDGTGWTVGTIPQPQGSVTGRIEWCDNNRVGFYRTKGIKL